VGEKEWLLFTYKKGESAEVNSQSVGGENVHEDEVDRGRQIESEGRRGGVAPREWGVQG